MVEGRRTVIYRDDAQGISVTVPNAIKFDTAERNTAGTGQFGYGDVIWELSSDELDEEPASAGVIDDVNNGESWSPVDVEHIDVANIWRCVCRRVRENVN